MCDIFYSTVEEIRSLIGGGRTNERKMEKKQQKQKMVNL
jgi:hypothetical protein